MSTVESFAPEYGAGNKSPVPTGSASANSEMAGCVPGHCGLWTCTLNPLFQPHGTSSTNNKINSLLSASQLLNPLLPSFPHCRQTSQACQPRRRHQENTNRFSEDLRDIVFHIFESNNMFQSTPKLIFQMIYTKSQLSHSSS